ncbi:GntR family transcriptional regulator [Planomonospora venezuelensis]|uniref:DNA-binding GntR family transcriptional regulator n=1 Tax=Planomonospora venezuelensis TaxID=1999 RepID=A0A841DCJ6_PLAVE|nr:GntR family transcriptional regulator [Planomonospora venezuelensis]MBB5966513.1 DNA-binding GntR family transcriptional regulator [Planomonospora venezuelensis]GIN02309.1 GntR family transcriptional regulator [Planomonospora venezuelensis]
MSVVDDLRNLILNGRYAPGARLGEVELAETLGVSRTPVREALRRLQAEGLVEVAANRGARVAQFPAGDLETVFELRARIEGLAARQAAAVATAEDADLLHETAVTLREHAGRRDLDAVYRLNADFHRSLVRLGGSAVLAQSLSALVHSPVLLRTYGSFDAEAMRRSVDHHVEIAAAVRAGDPDWAEVVMRAHLFSARASLLGPRRRDGG